MQNNKNALANHVQNSWTYLEPFSILHSSEIQTSSICYLTPKY